MNQDKIKSYVGFAIKSRKVKYGADEILKMRSPNLIILSSDIADNSKKKIFQRFADRTQIIEFSSEIMNFLFNADSIKAVAITDKNLSDAIIKQTIV